MSEPQLALRERVAAFAARELAALEPTLADDPAAARRAVAERALQAGIYRLLQPPELGGAGAGPVERVIVIETLARSNSRLARHALGPEPGLLAAAQGSLRERYLLPVLAGQKRVAYAITEPRDAERPTLARRETDRLHVSGRKSYVTAGAEADFYVVSVQLAGAAESSAAHALLLIDRATPGVHVERAFSSADGSGHVQLRFEDAQVPADQLLGAAAPSAAGALAGLTGMRLSVAARATGGALWALDATRARLLEPHRAGVPLGSREGVRLRLADMALALYAARSALYRTARLAASDVDARDAVMAAKILCTESAVAVVDRALLLAGGTALIQGHPLERLQRELRALLFAEGASDVLRVSLGKSIVERGVREP